MSVEEVRKAMEQKVIDDAKGVLVADCLVSSSLLVLVFAGPLLDCCDFAICLDWNEVKGLAYRR